LQVPKDSMQIAMIKLRKCRKTLENMRQRPWHGTS
jgi:hypothetical protein